VSSGLQGEEEYHHEFSALPQMSNNLRDEYYMPSSYFSGPAGYEGHGGQSDEEPEEERGEEPDEGRLREALRAHG